MLRWDRRRRSERRIDSLANGSMKIMTDISEWWRWWRR
jgi:hypothetical protein